MSPHTWMGSVKKCYLVTKIFKVIASYITHTHTCWLFKYEDIVIHWEPLSYMTLKCKANSCPQFSITGKLFSNNTKLYFKFNIIVLKNTVSTG